MRIRTVSRRGVALVVSAVALFLGCNQLEEVQPAPGETQTAPGDTQMPPEETLKLDIQATSGDAFTFLLKEGLPVPCNLPEGDAAGYVMPPLAELQALLGNTQDKFIVLLHQEIDNEAFPMPINEGRDPNASPESPAYLARAQAVAHAQLCAVAATEAAGGVYLHSFLLMNAFVASLTAEQAYQLSLHPHVRLVEYSQSSAPPPVPPLPCGAASAEFNCGAWL